MTAAHHARRESTVARSQLVTAVDASANRTGVLATVSGLAFPRDLTFDAWQQAGLRVARIANSSAWYLGDWLVYGKEKYRDRYKKAVDLVGLDYQTLRNYAWVARKVEYPRRRKDLSFQHHAEVAPLPPADQSRWLSLAERNSWSRSQLRQAVRGNPRGVPSEEHRALPRLSVPSSRVEVWRKAAAEADVEFGAWIVRALDRAAGTVLDAR